MSKNVLPIAPNGIFRTIQGEGALMGVPMIFVRLAGCSIGWDVMGADYGCLFCNGCTLEVDVC
jgi:organic radical activating enzyme